MKTFTALVKGSVRFSHGLLGCLQWARNTAAAEKVVVAIVVTRAGEKESRVIAEVDETGIRFIQHGRVIRSRRVLRRE